MKKKGYSVAGTLRLSVCVKVLLCRHTSPLFSHSVNQNVIKSVGFELLSLNSFFLFWGGSALMFWMHQVSGFWCGYDYFFFSILTMLWLHESPDLFYPLYASGFYSPAKGGVRFVCLSVFSRLVILSFVSFWFKRHVLGYVSAKWSLKASEIW